MFKNINVLSFWKLIVFNAVAIFAMVVLQNSDFSSAKFEFNFPKSKLINAIPQSSALLDAIRPKLEKIPANFEVKRANSLIPKAYAAQEYDLANAYVVLDLENGQVLLEKNLSEKTPIASITKVMSAVVALDLASPDEYFTVSENAALIEPTKIGVVAGERMKVSELIDAAILTSANDAVEVLKEGIDQKYGKGAFVLAMNEKAKIIGLKNTSFTNPQGFDAKDHYSTPEDLAKLAHYALNNYPFLKESAKRDYRFLPADNNHKQFDLYNWNGLLGVYPGASGIKIGNTGRAGYTTLVTSEREGKKLVVVLLGAPGVLERDLWAAGLLDQGFEKYGIKGAGVSEEKLKEKYSGWKYWN